MNDKTLKILFADDDVTYSLFLKRFLEKEGYEVIHVPDGEQALTQFRLSRPDLVLLDINMPEVNGFEVARQIRLWDKKVMLFFLSDRTEISDRLKGALLSLRPHRNLRPPERFQSERKRLHPQTLLSRRTIS